MREIIRLFCTNKMAAAPSALQNMLGMRHRYQPGSGDQCIIRNADFTRLSQQNKT